MAEDIEKKEMPGIMFFKEMLQTFDKLPDASVGKLVKAAYHLQFLGESEPDFDDDKMVADIVWPILRDRVLRNEKNYQETLKEKRLSGLYSDYVRTTKASGGDILDWKTWKAAMAKKKQKIAEWNGITEKEANYKNSLAGASRPNRC